jgi:hypothetical protein
VLTTEGLGMASIGRAVAGVALCSVPRGMRRIERFLQLRAWSCRGDHVRPDGCQLWLRP